VRVAGCCRPADSRRDARRRFCYRCADFVQTFLDHLVSWDFVEEQRTGAKAKL
jgi:hypothetical protein